MSLARFAVERRTLTYFCTALLIFAGMGSYFSLGQLEDPEFTIKMAAIVTAYPGASPEEVEQEVTEPLELSLQELHQVDYIESISRAGSSYITFNIKGRFKSHEIPQIFDEIRRKVNDVKGQLPPGAGEPKVVDDVGDVFGFLLAIVGDGFSPKELEDYAEDVRRSLSLVKGAARVDLWGVQEQAIYVDVATNQVNELGISPQTIADTLSKQNLVVNSGGVDINGQRLRIQTSGAFTSPQEIMDLTIRASALDQYGGQQSNDPDALIRLSDFSELRRGYRDPPSAMMRYNGRPAIGLAVSVLPGGNVVHLGAAIDERLEQLSRNLPVGIEFYRVAWQSDAVEESITSFMVSLAQAVIIVLVVLWLAMGLNNALIVGTALILTIVASFIVMAVYNIDLQRMSLGALVIALGMMVDNAIVVADGATVRVQQGMDRVKAAVEAASSTAWPLLAATVIAVSFFFPIYLSVENVGEYCLSLFQVVAISLLLSWVVSMTITPLQCAALLKREKSDEGRDPYRGKFYRVFKGFLVYCLRFRWITLAVSVLALAVSCVSFGYVDQMFFPDASRRQFMVDYWAPEGTRIQQVSEDLKRIEEHLLKDPRINAVSSFIGAGPPRFYLPVEPEKPYASYAQLIVNFNELKDLEEITDELAAWSQSSVPEALVRTRKYAVGPGTEFKFEARISAPGDVPLDEVRGLGEEGVRILVQSGIATDIRTDWRQRVNRIDADYDQSRGRWATVTRADMGRALKRAHDGLVVGQYREGDDLIPIVLRSVEQERHQLGNLDLVQITPQLHSDSVPLAQVASLSLASEDPIIWRRDRRRTITVQAEPHNVSLAEMRSVVVPQFEAMDLPPGYTIEWGGEYESSENAQESLIPGIMPVCAIVSLLLVALFNAYRTPIIIILVIPFAIIGLTAALLITRVPFGFMALLGAMSLAGMMIKNAIVLLDNVNLELDSGETPYQAIVKSALSRLRPVLLAAATTILGVVPLLQDVFWVSMAVVIMGGLLVGAILTMILVPVLYAIFYQVEMEG